jgi:calcineurin-like phosphoesterase family protein
VATWFTSDLHFGHLNIIRYCDRPWPDVDAMNRGLITRWNDVVDPDDTVWVLGDVAMGRIDDNLALVEQLNGSKLLVAGNHDRCWFGHGERGAEWIDRYRHAGFSEIVQGQTMLMVGGVEAAVCHFPYEGDSQLDDRYTEFRPVDEGRWLLHGHVHTTWAQRGRMINVGVDTAGYRPVSEDEIAALIAAGPRDLAALASA